MVGLNSRPETTWLMSSSFSIPAFPLSLTTPMEYREGSKRGHIWDDSEHNGQAGAKVSETRKKGFGFPWIEDGTEMHGTER